MKEYPFKEYEGMNSVCGTSIDDGCMWGGRGEWTKVIMIVWEERLTAYLQSDITPTWR
jgi:hypothetical protein